MGMTGTFDELSLSELLQLLFMSKKTGTLDLWRQADERKVFFKQGKIIFVEAIKFIEKLGDLLIKSKVINDRQLSKALKIQREKAPDKKVGEILKEHFGITDEQIISGIQSQQEESLLLIFSWDNGHFRFEDKNPEQFKIPIELDIDIQNIIMEGTRRIDEIERIMKLIPSKEAIPKLSSASDTSDKINLTPNEWKVLTLIDGQKGISQLQMLSSLTEFDTMKIIFSLKSVGFIEFEKSQVS
jgi:hypothetical protein